MNGSDSIPLKAATFLYIVAVRLPGWLFELEKESKTIQYICTYKKINGFSEICSKFLKIN